MTVLSWRMLPLWAKVLIFPWLVAATISSVFIVVTTCTVMLSAMVAAFKSVTRRIRKQTRRNISVMQRA